MLSVMDVALSWCEYLYANWPACVAQFQGDRAITVPAILAETGMWEITPEKSPWRLQPEPERFDGVRAFSRC